MNLTNGDVPMGLGMALAQNLDAMAFFSGMTKEQQQSVINATQNIQSKQEMQGFVQSLSKQEW